MVKSKGSQPTHRDGGASGSGPKEETHYEMLVRACQEGNQNLLVRILATEKRNDKQDEVIDALQTEVVTLASRLEQVEQKLKDALRSGHSSNDAAPGSAGNRGGNNGVPPSQIADEVYWRMEKEKEKVLTFPADTSKEERQRTYDRLEVKPTNISEPFIRKNGAQVVNLRFTDKQQTRRAFPSELLRGLRKDRIYMDDALTRNQRQHQRDVISPLHRLFKVHSMVGAQYHGITLTLFLRDSDDYASPRVILDTSQMTASNVPKNIDDSRLQSVLRKEFNITNSPAPRRSPGSGATPPAAATATDPPPPPPPPQQQQATTQPTQQQDEQQQLPQQLPQQSAPSPKPAAQETPATIEPDSDEEMDADTVPPPKPARRAPRLAAKTDRQQAPDGAQCTPLSKPQLGKHSAARSPDTVTKPPIKRINLAAGNDDDSDDDTLPEAADQPPAPTAKPASTKARTAAGEDDQAA
jgi:hypothetical protein